MKKKMDELKKMKLIYSGELFLFVIIAVVLGVLFLVGVIKVKDWKRWVFSIVTLAGGIWLIIDFIWTFASKKKRAKSSLFDKISVLPSALTLIVLDIYALCHMIPDHAWGVENNFFRYVIGCALCYLSLVYLAQGIYHLYVPHPSIVQAIEEEKAEAERARLEAIKIAEEKKDTESNENVSE